MLDSAQMVGFLFTTDYEKARAFFEEKLGFRFVSLDQFALVMEVGGHHVRIAKIPGFTPAPGTVLGWEVLDMEATVDALRQRGVVFEAYPFIQDKERCIWSTPGGDKVAWFKDPDGNVLSVSWHT